MRFPVFKLLVSFAFAFPANAEWIDLPWPSIGADLPVWKPDGFDAARRYPAIIHYHGTGGEPNASFIHRVTGGKSFVLVGMTYSHQGRFNYGDREISDELGLLGALKKTLVGSLSVDPSKIYVGGFSKGGWHTAMLLEYDRALAGGLVLGGGVFKERPVPVKFDSPVPIYIGCGRFDGNYPPSLGALVYFRKLGAGPYLEAWPETAHAFPEKTPEGLRQWLRLQAGEPGLTGEAAEWMDERLAEMAAIENPVARWLAYDEFTTLPFVKNFGDGRSALANRLISELLKEPSVAAERKWREESRRILVRESGDRLVTTLEAASRAHHALAEKAMGTLAGAEAQRDFERTRNLLETAEVVSRPVKGGAKTITPETTPAAPSGNPNRGPFFPPGIKVKSAE